MDEIKISYKYDLMHRNTPKFARTTIEWDTKLLTKITRNRVIRALHNPDYKVGHGDAGKMLEALRDKFEIPDCRVAEHGETRRHNAWTYLSFKHAPQNIREEVNRLLQAEIVMTRLEGNRYWGHQEVHPTMTGVSLYHPHDTQQLVSLMREFMESPEPKRRVNNALQFLEDGGVIRFTYDPTNR
jgi:hypothetical protein